MALHFLLKTSQNRPFTKVEMIPNSTKRSIPVPKGYTLEFRVKTDEPEKCFYPYFVNEKGYGFKAYITSTEVGLYNAYKKIFPTPPLLEKKAGKVNSITTTERHTLIVLQ